MTVDRLEAAQLGRLLRRDPREVWPHEALQFTPWLQQHIDELNEALGFEIELSGREERVGPFAVDLFGKEIQTGHPAIIENQLEPTDHTHLGQLLTYAAGLRAGIVVWIAPKFRDEHRSALNWLNEISPQDVNFFGIEIEILEINGQRAANFRPVAQPNNWGARAVSVSSDGGGVVSDRMLRYQRFFSDLLARLKEQSPGITAASKSQPQSWFSFASGKAGLAFSLTFASGQRFRIELYIDTGQRDRNVTIVTALKEQAGALEQAVGLPLNWELLEGKRATRVAAYFPGSASIQSPPEDLERLKAWASETTIRFVEAFRPRLKSLPV